LQEAEIAEPLDETELPGAERRVVAVRQATGHVAAIGQGIAGVAPVAVNVHLDIRHANPQHGGKIFHGPDRVHPIARAAAHQKCRRRMARNLGRGAIPGEGRGTRIDDAHEIGPRRNARQRIIGVAVLFVEIAEQDRRRSRQFRARREAHDADLVGIDAPFFGVGAHQADGLLRIVHRVLLHVVTILAQAIPQDDGADPVVVEKGNEIGAFRADIQRIVSAARYQDHGGAGVEPAIHRVNFDRRVVYVDDAVDAPRHGLAHVVLLGLADALRFEEGRSGRVKRHHHAARQDGLRSVPSVVRRPRFRHSQRRGKRG